MTSTKHVGLDRCVGELVLHVSCLTTMATHQKVLTTILSLLHCIFAASLKNYDSLEDKPISDLHLLIPLASEQQRSSRVHHHDFWNPSELPPDGPFSKIPPESFELDDIAGLFEEMQAPSKKTVKKDLSRLNEIFLKTPPIQGPQSSVVVDEDLISRCIHLLRILLERKKYGSNTEDLLTAFQRLCSLSIITEEDDEPIKFKATKYQYLSSKVPISNKWKGLLSSTKIKGHNIAEAGNDRLYDSFGIGSQENQLISNLYIGGNPKFNKVYFPKYASTNNYKKRLLRFLLGESGQHRFFPEENYITRNNPDEISQELPEGNTFVRGSFGLTGKLFDKSKIDDRTRTYGKLHNNAFERVNKINLQQSTEHNDADVETLHKGHQRPLDMNVNNETHWSKDYSQRNEKAHVIVICDENDKCGGRSLQVYDTVVDLIGKFSNHEPSSELSPLVYALTVGGKPGLEYSCGEKMTSTAPCPLLELLKYVPTSGRRDWSMIGGKHEQINPWLVV